MRDNMLLHLGGDVVIRTNDVIVILDYGKKQKDEPLQSLLEHYKASKDTVWITESAVKSVVVTEEKIYVSPIAAATLNKRSMYLDHERGEWL